MRRLALTATAVLLMGAGKPETVDYRLGVAADGQLDIELRFRGEPDGETQLVIPQRLASGLAVSGAQLTAPATLRHRPGAKIAIRYRSPSSPNGVAALGESLFAAPSGLEGAAATFRWSRLPKGWTKATDLEHGAMGRALTVAEVRQSVIVAGPDLHVAQRTLSNGVLRAALQGRDATTAEQLADAAVPVIAAHRAYFGDGAGPVLVVRTPAADQPLNRGDAVALPVAGISDRGLQRAIATAYVRAWVPERLGRIEGAPSSARRLADGIAGLTAERSLLRSGLLTPDSAIGQLAEADAAHDPGSRALILALKWDEDIRRKTAGKADLDDVILRMRDHYRQFPPGQGPDVVTGLVSAAWVVAQIDLRPDIARYADGGTMIPLPEQMFDGCLDARVTVTPGFDAGFDHTSSLATKVVKGVRRRGPAWNSGLRDGMRIETLKLTPGDMTREIELVVRPPRGGRARTIRFWPYGDVDVETRRLQLAHGLAGEALAACGRKIAGL
jgi:hypothetical protein